MKVFFAKKMIFFAPEASPLGEVSRCAATERVTMGGGAEPSVAPAGVTSPVNREKTGDSWIAPT